MPNLFPRETDILMTLDGDLAVGGDGDFELTRGFDWMAREVNKIVRTINPQWRHHPTIGANVESFIGENNTRETASALRQEILDAISRSTLLRDGQSIDVIVVPLSMESVSVYVNFEAPGISRELTKLVVDYRSGIAIDIPDETFRNKPEPLPGTRETENKYLKRITESSN